MRQMIVTPLGRDPGPCRCDTAPDPHPLQYPCWRSGRPPRTGPAVEPVSLDPLELADRLDAARAEGYDEGRDDVPDVECDVAHCPDDCDGSCQSDDTVQVERVIDALSGIYLSRKARVALAGARAEPADRIGEGR